MTIPFRYFLAAHVPVWCMVVGLGVVWNPPTAPRNVPGVQILAAPSDRIEGLVIPTRKTGEASGNPGQMAQRICFDYHAGNASLPIPEDGTVCLETLGKDRGFACCYREGDRTPTDSGGYRAGTPFDSESRSDANTGGSTQSNQDLLREVKYGIILAAADKCGVEPGLAIALGMRESGLVWPEKKHAARGIYQVKDATARGVSRTLDNRTVWGNAVAGLCYLRQLSDREGSWEAALLSYREGPHRKATSREAHAYVADIMEEF